MNLINMYKLKVDIRDKMWTSEIKFISHFKKMDKKLFKLNKVSDDFYDFISLHGRDEEYHVPNTDYTMKFTWSDDVPLTEKEFAFIELTSDHDLDRMFNTLEMEMVKNGLASGIGLIHKLNTVSINIIMTFLDLNQMMEGSENEAQFISVEDLKYIMDNIYYLGNMDIISAIDEEGSEFEYNDDPTEFIKRINRENRIKNLLNKDI
ncbi:MAG: hypothetical protein SLAVMIC_00652 [uncultured marine phage]|uniref:Uncharacterized protein n=1 Tax=uncultured marine phage TaxID=707152 RepID=A0A8D9CFI9_9VIRU|nr:MAG: hypothetical protein SLAVMIC_00652 [uncultured marine phage]